MREPKINPPIPILLPSSLVHLVSHLLLARHVIPQRLPLAIQVDEMVLLRNKHNADCDCEADEDFVGRVVVWFVVVLVDFWLC